MGGVLASYVWMNQKLIIKKLILESSPIMSFGKIMTGRNDIQKCCKIYSAALCEFKDYMAKGKGHCEDALLNPKKWITELNKVLL